METKAKSKQINGIDIYRLHETLKLIRANPDLADFKFRAENTWISGAHNKSSIMSFYGAGQEDETRSEAFVLTADEPDILLGTNNGPNPTETLLHALAACITTTLAFHAAANGYEVKSVSSTYEGDIDLNGFLGLDPNVPKGFQKIRIKFWIEGDLTDEQKMEVLNLGRTYSPVHDLVSRVVPLEVTLMPGADELRQAS